MRMFLCTPNVHSHCDKETSGDESTQLHVPTDDRTARSKHAKLEI